MGFQAFEDEFRCEGLVLVRHLVSIRLSEVSPVSQPAYFDTTTAIRSVAGQVGEDPEEVAALAARGELGALFTRPDLAGAAPPTVQPGVTEHRSGEPSSGSIELELRRKLSDERARRWGTTSCKTRASDYFRSTVASSNGMRRSSHSSLYPQPLGCRNGMTTLAHRQTARRIGWG
jgi:hypothetical protein